MAASSPRIELFLRSLAPTDTRSEQERLVARLEELADEDRILGVDYTLCGECVCPSAETATADIAQLLLDRYEAFESWADGHDRDLVGFDRRNTDSLLTGTTITGIVFPRMVLAEYRSGELTFVAPSTNGNEHTTIADRLEHY